MENKELTEESPKEDVAEFCKLKLGFQDDALKIIIKEFISGDVLPFISEQELAEIGFNLNCRTKILKHVKKNSEKFKKFVFKESISFNSTTEETKKFFEKNFDFLIKSNDIDGKKIIKLKDEEMKKLGMKLGQRKRLRNLQKQILVNVLKNIKVLKDLIFIFDNFCKELYDEEFSILLRDTFKDLFYVCLNYKENDYENFYTIFHNILIINYNNQLDLDNICETIEFNFELACKYYLSLSKSKYMKNIFNKILNHIISFFQKILPIQIYTHYFLEIMINLDDKKFAEIMAMNPFNDMIFEENDFFKKGKNGKILFFQTFLKNKEIILKKNGTFNLIFQMNEMIAKIEEELNNSEIKYIQLKNAFDEEAKEETIYEKILLIINNENKSKIIYSKLKDEFNLCKEKFNNIEKIIEFYSTFYPNNKKEIIVEIKFILTKLEYQKINQLINMEIEHNFSKINNFYFDEALEEAKNVEFKYSMIFMSIYNRNNLINKKKFSEEKIFKMSFDDYNNLLKNIMEKSQKNISLFNINNIDLLIKAIKSKEFDKEKEINLIRNKLPLFKDINFFENFFFNDLIIFTKKYDIVKFIEGIIQFINYNNKINENKKTNYIKYLKDIFDLIKSNNISEKNCNKIISSLKFNEYHMKKQNYSIKIFRALLGNNESLITLQEIKDSIINNQENSNDIYNIINFYDLIQKILGDKNISTDDDFFKLIDTEKSKDENLENILNEIQEKFSDIFKDKNNINNNTIYQEENDRKEIQSNIKKNDNIIKYESIQFEILFNYNQNIIRIQCNDPNEKMKNIFEKFSTKSGIGDLNDIYFISGGNVINAESKLSEIITNVDKQKNSMIILVNSNINIQKENSLIKSNIIICPKCHELTNLEIKNYKINLFGCKNNHIINDILFTEFDNTQNIDLKNIICDICQEKNKFESYHHEFYRCATCAKNLCVLCKSTHDKNHIIFDYDKKYALCPNHLEPFCSYCLQCKINLCINCEKKHLNHDIVSYSSFIPDAKETEMKLVKLKDEIDKFSKNINDIIDKLNTLKENMEKYYEIFNNAIKYIDNKNRNFEILNNINEITNSNIYKDLCCINQEKNMKNKIYLIFDIIEKIKKKDEITLIYNIDKNSNFVKLFDSEFVNNNKNNCKIIFGNKEYTLTENFEIKNDDMQEEKLEMKLTGVSTITNASKMFYECKQLYSLPDIDKWDLSNVKEKNEMFNECKQCDNILNKICK